MNVFISYSNADKIIAGNLYQQLVEHGVDAFLAHETIDVADDWKLRILDKLTDADAMIVLVSAKSKASDWVGHEVGYFYAKSEQCGCVIPISLDGTIFYGIIANWHCGQIPKGSSYIPLQLWLKPLLKVFTLRLIPSVLKMLGHCKNARFSEIYMELLSDYYTDMSDEMLHSLIKVVISNHNVHNAFECRSKHIPEFVSQNSGRLKMSDILELQRCLDRFDFSSEGRVVLMPSNQESA